MPIYLSTYATLLQLPTVCLLHHGILRNYVVLGSRVNLQGWITLSIHEVPQPKLIEFLSSSNRGLMNSLCKDFQLIIHLAVFSY